MVLSPGHIQIIHAETSQPGTPTGSIQKTRTRHSRFQVAVIVHQGGCAGEDVRHMPPSARSFQNSLPCAATSSSQLSRSSTWRAQNILGNHTTSDTSDTSQCSRDCRIRSASFRREGRWCGTEAERRAHARVYVPQHAWSKTLPVS